ncbi:5227_t:CDS:2 [Funneliformis mosseae]|uniref:5227_t:CDS:1 n=1 Tax=Funneliformis mosseae TaxID=27381 RepID=A0A9N9HKP5_FUNMO|nr:5227_t:CDS:2 [Funneliformis mosseae]
MSKSRSIWTPFDDCLLVQAVNLEPTTRINWNVIAGHFRARNSRSCRISRRVEDNEDDSVKRYGRPSSSSPNNRSTDDGRVPERLERFKVGLERPDSFRCEIATLRNFNMGELKCLEQCLLKKLLGQVFGLPLKAVMCTWKIGSTLGSTFGRAGSIIL